jgi:hypothetical protein
MKRLLCALGIHRVRGWAAHTECVFVSEVHNFRKCERCPKMQHSFSTIAN